MSTRLAVDATAAFVLAVSADAPPYTWQEVVSQMSYHPPELMDRSPYVRAAMDCARRACSGQEDGTSRATTPRV